VATSKQQTGDTGERLARQYLEEKGFIFVARHWLCKMGELDLIMNDGLTRVFIEVRVRSNTAFGSGADSVAWRKQQRLIRAAAHYQQRTNYWGDTRFDVVSIDLSRPELPQIEHIEYAFEVS
jgi:putative endonuclease